MLQYYENIAETLQENIRELFMEIDSPIVLSEECVKLVLKSLSEMRNFVITRKFKDEQEEILFFKELKPQILSKLIYHNSVLKIETKKPNGGEKIIRKYYENQLAKLKIYFENNLDFYKYYRTGSSYLDQYYFVRGKYDIKLNLDTYFFESDHSFNTSYDYKAAKIIANDQLQVYLENELAELYKKYTDNNSQRIHNSVLKWTAPKVSMIELMYALHSEGVLNNGTADLKDIAECFEKIFSVDLGQYRRTFLEIRVRKSDRTKFIDKLRKTLIDRMDNADE